MLNRRTFIGSAAAAGLTAAACAPQAAPAGPTGAGGGPKAAWEQEWDNLVTAAKKEGQFVVMTAQGASYRKALGAFEEAFPGITVDHTTGNASTVVPRLLQEIKGGIYSHDVLLTTVTTPYKSLRPADALQPVRPLIFRPDVVDDTVWRDGFEAGFFEKEKRWMYAATLDKSVGIWINTDQVRENEITKLEDLLNPKWRGRMISTDIRSVGTTWNVLDMKRGGGEEFVRKLYGEQKPVLVRDLRQGSEFMVKGQYAIGIGLPNEDIVRDFWAEGLGKNLKQIEIDWVTFLLCRSHLYSMSQAPHPNAMKLFVNWFLTKEAQTGWAQTVGQNSRRLDVPAGDPLKLPTPGKKYLTIENEEQQQEVDRIYELAREILN